ncbi:TetR/AcrR family transcriptional regulator [Micromonospora yangpuensis]|uniref:Transcriptional regulator, TetR family n=1 Tax=Micromonospora yangpuensis TaxID=683228 RepID=A0A1C6V2F5_9ACTN|nr:TetR/AcrR family transcriptional regulator [Micromonospora yangpuensis]GGL98455.1 TetR family transcriptional regulator [Micromonospora yangpuensis]SCL60475.1 transcriptional regulator, TetR family [Micromonospora yangpuensis]
MARLTRAELQQRNRARVLAAAREVFVEQGFREARIDDIADRAELTRGAVYSNFPGKRALYFAVLAAEAEQVPEPTQPASAGTVAEALAEFAQAWLTRLPLAVEEHRAAVRLGRDLMPEILADEATRRPYAELTKLSAILLGLGLEALAHRPGPLGRDRPEPLRLVRLAEAALTTLHGASQLAAAAPGFGDPFDVPQVCRHLAGLDLGDRWAPPHLPYVPKARPVDEPWQPPDAADVLRDAPARLAHDGVVTILGLHRIGAVEEAIRSAPPNTVVTAVLVTGEPRELLPLARLTLVELRTCLRRAVPPDAWPRVRVVCDTSGAVAAAAGVPAVSDATESAVRIEAGRIVARADGYGASHATSV